MGYLLFFIESLAVSLLVVATLAACTARLSKGPRRRPSFARILAIVVALLPLAVYASFSALTGWLHWQHNLTGWQFPVLASLALAYLCGAVWLLAWGLRRRGEPPVMVAASWPRARLAVALLAAVALHLMTFWNMDLAARQQLASLRVETGAAALSVAPPRIPDRDNAAIVYQQAFDAMGRNDSLRNTWEWEKQWQTAWDEKWTQWHRSGKIDFDLNDPELRRFLKRQAPALALLRQAAAKPGCHFERDYGRPSLAMMLPELAPLRTAANLLALEAVSRAADGDHRGAIDDINAMFLMAEHVGSDPLLLSALVAMAIDQSAADTLQVTLASGKVPPEALAALRISDTLSYRKLLQRAFRMEEALRLATFQQVGEGQWSLEDVSAMEPGDADWFGPCCIAPLYRVFLLGEDLQAHSRCTAQLEATIARPLPQAKEGMEALEQDLRDRPGGILTACLVPALARTVETGARADATRDVVRLAVAACRFRAQNGRLPDKLDALVPDFIAFLPRDPCDGQPMRLRRTERGLMVYSIGPDLTDNGGARYDREKRTGDVAFEVPQ